MANPNGTYAGGDNTVFAATRSNSLGYDLNRNYPDPDPNDGPTPGGPQQEETSAFINFAASRDFNISANMHGGIEVANYPWDTYWRRHADDNWWQYVCRNYADSAQANGPSGFFSAFNSGITNGSDWYFVSGGRQDYMNTFEYCREFTLELSDAKTPSSNSLESFWNYHKASLINYIEEALYGLRGTVTDSLSGEALEARVFIQGHDQDSSHVYSSMPIGNYHRYLFSGSYNVSFRAEGYLAKNLTVSVQNGQSSRLDVQLLPEVASGIADLKKEIAFKLYPNPVNDRLEIELLELTGPVQVNILDLSGRKLLQEDMPMGRSTSFDLSQLAAGMYILRLESEEGYGVKKFLKK